MKATTFAITTLLLAIGSISDAKLVEVTRRKLEKHPRAKTWMTSPVIKIWEAIAARNQV